MNTILIALTFILFQSQLSMPVAQPPSAAAPILTTDEISRLQTMAEAGDTVSQMKLAVAYDEGNGVPQNAGEAVAEAAGPVLFKMETTAYKARVGTTQLSLFVAKSPELPVAVSLRRGEKNDIFLYSHYSRTAFDPTLFAKPQSVKIEDSKP